MTLSTFLGGPWRIWGIAAALLSALLFATLLAKLSTPPDLKDRLAAADLRIRQADVLVRRAKRSPAPIQASVCSIPAQDYASLLRRSLVETVNRAGIKLSGLEIRPLPPKTPDGLVDPIGIRIQSKGSYSGTLVLLDELAKHEPQLYAETVDLKPSSSETSLVFVGRVFCAG